MRIDKIRVILTLIIMAICIYIGISGVIKTFIYNWHINNGIVSLVFLYFGLYPIIKVIYTNGSSE